MATIEGVLKSLLNQLPTPAAESTPAEDIIAQKTVSIIKFFIETGVPRDVRLSSYSTVDELVADPSYCPTLDETARSSSPKEVAFDKKVKVVEAYMKGKTAAVKRLLKSSKIPQRNTILQWKKEIHDGGSIKDKQRAIRIYVAEMFDEARSLKRCVTTAHLGQWALVKAREIGLQDFKASRSYLEKLKSELHLSSRKVTKYFTAKQVASLDVDFDAQVDFVLEVKQVIAEKNIPPHFVWNLDQSGYTYAVQQNRTLSYKGEKTTGATIESMNKMTHSYSIQVAIAADGSTPGPLQLCLQESTGSSFGPRVKESVQQFEASFSNIMVSCSKSGKFGTENHKQYIQTLMSDVSTDQEVLLLIDSWSGQIGSDAKQLHNSYPNLTVMVIPPGATAELQPEDIFYFRQRKIIWKKAAAHVRLFHPEIDITDRESILYIQAHIHDQLQSPLIYPMIQYAFSKPGYFDTDLLHFESINDICFRPLSSSGICSQSSNENPCKPSFIICSHCLKSLCFNHFFKVHYHVVKS